MRQILVNLLGNASKFTEKGRIEAGFRHADDELVFWVADTGQGMDASQLEHLFKAYEQVGGQHLGGTGLGLLISRKFAELMGGELTVESEPGEGTRFTARIPAPRVA